MNASSALYYYRDQPSSYVMQVQGLDGVYGKWTMNSFYQNEGYAVPDASIRGGKVSIWQGGLGKVTDHETEAWIADGLRYGAQMFWNGKTPKAAPDTQASRRVSTRSANLPPTPTPRVTPSLPASTRSHWRRARPEHDGRHHGRGCILRQLGVRCHPRRLLPRSARSTRTAASPSTPRKRLTPRPTCRRPPDTR